MFIDSSVTSLKVVLLHIGNKYPSVPIAHATCMAETYENMKIILDAINYNKHTWMICCDLKVVSLLTGVKKRIFEAPMLFVRLGGTQKRSSLYQF